MMSLLLGISRRHRSFSTTTSRRIVQQQQLKQQQQQLNRIRGMALAISSRIMGCDTSMANNNGNVKRWNSSKSLSSSSSSSSSSTTLQPSSRDRKQTRLPRTLYRQLLQWCHKISPDVPLHHFVMGPIQLTPPQVDPFQLQALAKSAQSIPANEKEKDDGKDEQKMNRNLKIATMLPPGTYLNPAANELTVSIRRSTDIRQLIRAIFRLNSIASDSDSSGGQEEEEKLRKERISFAFQTLRTLNELTTSLSELNRQRQLHMNRGDIQDDNEGNSTTETAAAATSSSSSSSSSPTKKTAVLYRVGQVVRHKGERWRGVIIGWEKPESMHDKKENDDDSIEISLTSLTTKVYKAGDFLNSVRYEIIVDAGDVHMMQGSSSAVTSFIVTTQEDLEPEVDPHLCRIRSGLMADHFDRFDATTNSFVLNDMLAYEYPLDYAMMQQEQQQNQDQQHVSTTAAVSLQVTALEVNNKIQAFAKYLEKLITLTKEQEDRVDIKEVLNTLDVFKTKIAETWSGVHDFSTGRQRQGQQQPAFVRLQGAAEEASSPVAAAASRIRQLLNLWLEVRDLLGHRQTSRNIASELRFGLGDVVYHKVFQFRGVVVAIDDKPTVDVSRWDGVQHIDNPLDKPFYHVIPDQQDCLESFGGGRGMRYVCEDNLESCHNNRRALTVTLDPGWTRTLNPEGTNVFLPPVRTKFKHGLDLDDDGVTETTLNKIREAMTVWMVACRDGTAPIETNSNTKKEDTPVAFRLSLDDLFTLLRATESMEEAIPIEETIKEIWKAHLSHDLRWRLDQAIANVLRGKSGDALEACKALAEEDSQYSEAWNKIAACEYMLGNIGRSLETAKRTVELIPTHFQAHNGIGLCEYDAGRYGEAAAAFRRSLDLDPWSPVSSKLAACIDILDRQSKSSDKERS